MSKSKSKGSKDVTKSTADVLTKVKDAAVTKPIQTMKAKSKEIAKAVAIKEDKKSKKSKKVKEPSPEPSDSESEESESESEDSASSADSDSENSDESEVETKKPAVNGKSNGVKALAAPADSSNDSDSDSSDSSTDEAPASAKTNGVKIPAAAAAEAVKAEESSDESDDSEEDDEDSDGSSGDEKPAAKAVPKTVTPVAAAESDDDSEEDSDDSEADSDDSDDSDSSEDEVAAKPANKRKAEENAVPVAKKTKTETNGAAPEVGNLFVGNLSWNVDEDWLTREFETFGELSGVRIITDRETGRSKGFGYVEFSNIADATKAHAAMSGADLDGRTINVDFAAPRQAGGNQQDRSQDRRKSYGDQTSAPSDTLFCGNLSFDAGQDSISEAFGEYGTILGVRLPTDRETGNPKGFGYVTFSSIDEATTAMEAMQGADIAGRSVRLDYSQPRPQNGDSPARGRGGFGGGRGGGRGFGDRGGRGGGRGFGDRGGRGGGRGRGGFGDRGGRGGGRGASTNRGGFSDFSGKKTTF